EEDEGVEVTGVEVDPLVPPPELPVGDVEEEVVEAVPQGGLSHAHGDLRRCSRRSYGPSASYAAPGIPPTLSPLPHTRHEQQRQDHGKPHGTRRPAPREPLANRGLVRGSAPPADPPR